MKQLGVFREFHVEDENGVAHAHYHIAVLAERGFMFLLVKRALLKDHGLASQWSCTHIGYSSVIRYLFHPSPPKKPDASLDKGALKWAATGYEHPPFEECCSEPLTAKALAARRMAQDRTAAENSEGPPKITELGVWPVVVQHGFKNTAEDQNAKMKLMVWSKKHASQPMQMFLFKNRARLGSLIDDIWQWESVEADLEVARLNRMEALKAAAIGPCACQGLWAAAVKQSFDANGIDVRALCSDILAALETGRDESIPVVVLVGARGGEGKSLLLKALYSVYGNEHVFKTPEKGNFPLIELPGKKVAFLDEWRFDNMTVSFATQMQWFDGSQLSISRPQNISGAAQCHINYEGKAPIFATTREADLARLEELAKDDVLTGKPKCAEAAMMMRRLRVYKYSHRIPKPAKKVPFCKCCFAKLVLSRGVESAHALWAAKRHAPLCVACGDSLPCSCH